MHLQAIVDHNVHKGLLQVPGDLSIELLLKKLKGTAQESTKSFISYNPSKDSQEYKHAFTSVLSIINVCPKMCIIIPGV